MQDELVDELIRAIKENPKSLFDTTTLMSMRYTIQIGKGEPIDIICVDTGKVSVNDIRLNYDNSIKLYEAIRSIK